MTAPRRPGRTRGSHGSSGPEWVAVEHPTHRSRVPRWVHRRREGWQDGDSTDGPRAGRLGRARSDLHARARLRPRPRTCSTTIRPSGAVRTTAWRTPSSSSRPSPPRGSAASPIPPSSGWAGTSPVSSASPNRFRSSTSFPATGCYTYDQVPFFFFYRGPALSAMARHRGARPDGGHVHRRHHRGHRRDRCQSRVPQVRHRPSGHDRRCGPGHAGGGPGAPPHRCSHHRAHPSGFSHRPGRQGAVCATRKESIQPESCWVIPATARTSTT